MGGQGGLWGERSPGASSEVGASSFNQCSRQRMRRTNESCAQRFHLILVSAARPGAILLRSSDPRLEQWTSTGIVSDHSTIAGAMLSRLARQPRRSIASWPHRAAKVSPGIIRPGMVKPYLAHEERTSKERRQNDIHDVYVDQIEPVNASVKLFKLRTYQDIPVQVGPT